MYLNVKISFNSITFFLLYFFIIVFNYPHTQCNIFITIIFILSLFYLLLFLTTLHFLSLLLYFLLLFVTISTPCLTFLITYLYYNFYFYLISILLLFYLLLLFLTIQYCIKVILLKKICCMILGVNLPLDFKISAFSIHFCPNKFLSYLWSDLLIKFILFKVPFLKKMYHYYFPSCHSITHYYFDI